MNEDKYITIDLKLEIKRNSDGIISESIWKDWQWYNTYWWEEGNASCDCNREDWFNQGLNIDTEEDSKCGHGKYSVKLYDLTNSEILYDEFS